ncbi:histidine kinase [Sediminitomix flava]|uniref:Histidine kinase n=2 Tax=Sediminitomix flava TaxID=379075 RepID=A0A315Z8R3_SEDFL|nr:histidine kinase [Sediminitomix flava]
MVTLALSGFISEEKIRIFFTKMLPLIFSSSIVSVFCYHFIVRKLNEVLPWKNNLIVRGLVDIAVVMFVTSIVLSIMYMSFGEQTLVQKVLSVRKIGVPIEGLFVLPLVEHILFMVATEFLEVIDERNELELNLERMEKAQLQTKYSALKNQLDNHFLFNNLSVLSSLIYEDVEKSDRFIQEFAKVYRYVLSISEEMLVPVEKELDFIEAYLFLLKIRFEEGFQVRNDLDEDVSEKKLPPLSLQVLIENAIKHNCISKRHPLHIHIYEENDEIIVTNNYQPRDRPDTRSTHTGLKNLTEKYKLISEKVPSFGVQEENYVAVLPLIDSHINV